MSAYTVLFFLMLSLFIFDVPAVSLCFFFFFFIDPAPTEIYTLSLHDALPILRRYLVDARAADEHVARVRRHEAGDGTQGDRKSTRLNSSHANISYAVFCLKKKKKTKKTNKKSETLRRYQQKQ